MLHASLTMRFSVSDLILDGIGASRTYHVDGTCELAEGEPVGVRGVVEMVRTDGGVLVRAHLRLNENEACSRCLRPLVEPVAVEFEEEFRVTVDPRTGATVERDNDPDAFMIDEQDVIDLTEAVRQYRETALEMAPLCRPDCKGLCPNCGRDLNVGPCGCDGGPIDGRWAKLAALKGAVGDGRE
jgi:DUF177 domain-containing protein